MKFLRRFFHRGDVSETWLRDYALTETKAGVDLPRWRFPKEQQQMRQAAKHNITAWRNLHGNRRAS